MAGQLQPIGMGLGARLGYSGDDLTNPRGACLRGEVPYLPAFEPVGPGDVLEMRIHGVGGAPPEDNLEAPSTLQVAGDGTAGFFRAWFPGGQARAEHGRTEAYCWGKLNYRSATRALWLLLLSFMIVNVAYWALPPAGAGAAGPRRDAMCRGLLRILGLAFTAAFFGTALTVLADMAAYQAPKQGALPSWLRSFARIGAGPRLAVALLAVLAILGLLFVLSLRTARSYEKWDAGASADRESAGWALTHKRFWRGERTVVRQRYCHVLIVAAEVLLVAAAPSSSHGAVRATALVLAAAVAVLAVVLVGSHWADRVKTAGREEQVSDQVLRVVTIGAVSVAALVSAARFFWRPSTATTVLPASQGLTTYLVLAQFAVIAALAAVLLTQRPWRQRDVMGLGMAPVLLALLASLISTIFGAAFTLTIANLLGTPRSQVCTGHRCAGDVLYLSSTVYAGGLGMLATIVSALLFGLWSLRWVLRRRRCLAQPHGAGTVRSVYPAMDDGERAVRRIAGVWASSAMTDLAAASLTSLTLAAGAAVLGAQIWETALDGPLPRFWSALASFGGTLGVLATGFFLVQLRSALLNANSRKRFGFVWDVGTFWPRACHPFAPPCYAERSVPELVTRIRRVVGDVERHGESNDPALAQQEADLTGARTDDPREAHTPVLLSGYSQGSPIAVAVVAQLPAEVLPQVALLTLAAPVRRLYGRTFPAYFGPQALAELRDRLTTGDVTRWRNLVRRSDYIGGWALAEPTRPATAPIDDVAGADVDYEILDPPVLCGDEDPTRPPIHRHSDLFPDPQTRPYAHLLAGLVPAPSAAAPVELDGADPARVDALSR